MTQAISSQKRYMQGRPNLRRPRSLKVTFGSGERPTACDPNTYKQTYSWRLRVSVRLRRTLVWHAHSGPLLTCSLLYLFKRRDLCLYVIRDYDSSLPQDHETTSDPSSRACTEHVAHRAVSIAYHRARPSRAINEDHKKKKDCGLLNAVVCSRQ